MGLKLNISSVFLLSPYIYHYNILTTCEKSGIISIAFISFLFHSARESNSTESLKAYLYKLDHLQIHLGLTYLTAKSLGLHPDSHALIAWYIVNAIIDLCAYTKWANMYTSILVIGHFIRTVYSGVIHYHLCNMGFLLLGFMLAKNGYKGTNICGINISNIKELINCYPHWDEKYKCMWHSGAGIIATCMLVY